MRGAAVALEFECGACDARFKVADELAGKRVKCGRCGTLLELPPPEPFAEPLPPFPTRSAPAGPRYPAFAPPPDDAEAEAPAEPAEPRLHPAFKHDFYQMKQKLFAINETYRFELPSGRTALHAERKRQWLRSIGAGLATLASIVVVVGVCMGLAVLAGGGRLEPNAATVILLIAAAPLALAAAFVVSATLGPKRHVEFFADEAHSVLLLEIKEDSLWQFVTRTYTVVDPEEGTIGRLEKNVFTNFFRKRWHVYNQRRTLVALGQETPWFLALLRRYGGPILEFIPFDLLPIDFALLRPVRSGGHRRMGFFKRKWRIRDEYDLNLRDDPRRRFDRRLALALAVMLDTGERR